MKGSSVEITAADGVADAYLTRPDDAPHPGVLFIMDAYGLRPTIDEMADRIAADGYVVLAPNVFYRAGRSPVLPVPDPTDPDQRTSFWQSVRPLIDQLTPERLAADGAAYLDYLEAVASPGAVAITGYCMGARVGWRIAAAHPDRVAALAGFHAGGLVTDAPDSPHRSAADLKADLYFGFADQDPSMTGDQIAARATAPKSMRARSTDTRWLTGLPITRPPASATSASCVLCSSGRLDRGRSELGAVRARARCLRRGRPADPSCVSSAAAPWRPRRPPREVSGSAVRARWSRLR